jgi:PAS domain S-box-containing protein
MPNGVGASAARYLLPELFDQASVGVAVLDSELRYVYVNPALAEINGAAAEDHLGRSIDDIVPELAPHARPVFQAVLESGQPHLGWELAGETAAAPGEARWFAEDIYPVSGDGSTAALGVVVLEITERRRAEDELRQQRERARRLLAQLERGLTPLIRMPATWSAAWRYRGAVDEMLLGGDFLGLTERADGSLAFLIGDVAGRGPAAAGVGASLRSGWRALVEAGVEPAAQLAALDRVLASHGEPGFATVCCGRFSESGQLLEIVSAGHHPPLRLSRGHHTGLEIAVGPALGVSREPEWPTTVIPAVECGLGLLLTTDGAFEGGRSAGARRRLDYEDLAPEVPIELLEAGDLEGCLDELLIRIEAASGGALADDVALLLIAGPGRGRDQ